MKIKDLSSSNIVAGEGLPQWNIADVAGRTVTLELPGYHVPGVEVRLLSPQVLLSIFGGHTMQTTQRVEVCLEKWFDSTCTLMSTEPPSLVTVCTQ